MIRRIACCTFVAAFGLAAFTPGGEKGTSKDDDPVAKALSQIAQVGQGVHKIKTDKQGRIVSCVIVGQSRISTVLGTAKGLEIARDRAILSAKAEFVKWLKEKVSVHQSTSDETILFLEGSEENDKETLKESGKAVEKTSKKMESIAEGVVRGMQILHKEVNGKEKTYTLVYGWDRKSAEEIRKVYDDLNKKDKGTAPAKEAKKEGDSSVQKGKKEGDSSAQKGKKIEDSSATSKDAKKFID